MCCSHANSCTHTDPLAARSQNTHPHAIQHNTFIIIIIVNAEWFSANAVFFFLTVLFAFTRSVDVLFLFVFERIQLIYYIAYGIPTSVCWWWLLSSSSLSYCVYAIATATWREHNFHFVLSANYFHIRETKKSCSRKKLLSSSIQTRNPFNDISNSKKKGRKIRSRNWKTLAVQWIDSIWLLIFIWQNGREQSHQPKCSQPKQ